MLYPRMGFSEPVTPVESVAGSTPMASAPPGGSPLVPTAGAPTVQPESSVQALLRSSVVLISQKFTFASASQVTITFLRFQPPYSIEPSETKWNRTSMVWPSATLEMSTTRETPPTVVVGSRVLVSGVFSQTTFHVPPPSFETSTVA